MIRNCKPVCRNQAEPKHKNGCPPTHPQSENLENCFANFQPLLFCCDQRCHKDLDNERLEIQALVLRRGVSIRKRQISFASLQNVFFQTDCRQ